MVRLIFFLFIFLVCPTGVVIALDSDRNQPAIVDAQDIEIDFAKGRWIYRGNVTIKKGTLHMTADEIQLIFVNDILERAIAHGQPAVFQQQPEGSDYLIRGQAQQIEIDEIKNIAIFSGDAKLQHHRDTITGESIIYFIETEQMTVQGNATVPGQTTRLSASQIAEKQNGNKSDSNIRPKVIIQPQLATTPGESNNKSLEPTILSTMDDTGKQIITESANSRNLDDEKLDMPSNSLQFNPARIIDSGTAAYSEPNADASLLGGLSGHVPVKVIKIHNDWARVIIPGGINVWVFSRFLATMSNGETRIEGRGVRARWLPSTESRIIGVFESDEQVRVFATRDNWSQVSLPSSVAIWIPVTQLEILEDISSEWQSEWATDTGVLAGTGN